MIITGAPEIISKEIIEAPMMAIRAAWMARRAGILDTAIKVGTTAGLDPNTTPMTVRVPTPHLTALCGDKVPQKWETIKREAVLTEGEEKAAMTEREGEAVMTEGEGQRRPIVTRSPSDKTRKVKKQDTATREVHPIPVMEEELLLLLLPGEPEPITIRETASVETPVPLAMTVTDVEEVGKTHETKRVHIMDLVTVVVISLALPWTEVTVVEVTNLIPAEAAIQVEVISLTIQGAFTVVEVVIVEEVISLTTQGAVTVVEVTILALLEKATISMKAAPETTVPAILRIHKGLQLITLLLKSNSLISSRKASNFTGTQGTMR